MCDIMAIISFTGDIRGDNTGDNTGDRPAILRDDISDIVSVNTDDNNM